MRISEITRKTNETSIFLSLVLDGNGRFQGSSGVGFFDHMLELFARHGGLELTLECKGDTLVDFHHTVEDVGIVLGQAIKSALGDCRGISRFADAHLPMDEALVLAALDISGRGHLVFEAHAPSAKVGEFDTELAEEFFSAVAREAGLALHLRLISGKNTHHIIEAMFKAFGRVLRNACKIVSEEIPSTKGIL